MKLNFRVNVDYSGLKRFQKELAKLSKPGGHGPIRKALKQWAYRFFVFSVRRFYKLSKGGGEWPSLKPGTIRRRRKGSGTGTAKILINTHVLLNALTPGISSSAPPGQVNKDIPYGVRVGYGGSSKHSNDGLTIAQIADWHQTGAGNLPVRQIIVDPDSGTLKAMAKDMENALKESVDG